MTQTDQRGAGIYGRQSHGKETSVEDQIGAGHARCRTLGTEVAEVYRDKVSASRFGTREREDWPRLVADVEAGRFGLVWLWDASRGDRTPESWFSFLGACRDQRVALYSERDEYTYRPWVPRDWKTLADSGVDAAYESEIKSVDVRRGVAGAAAKGRPHGRVRYGYSRVYDQADRTQFTDVPNEYAPIAVEIIERVARRDPVVTIERDLNARGIPSPQGARWARNTIKALVRNPGYAGLRSHKTSGKTELYQGNWAAIVDRKVWEDARAVLAEPDRKNSAPGGLKWLLSYLAFTACGATFHAQPDKRKERMRQADRYRCPEDGCVSIGVTEADEFVTRVILARLSLPNARELFASNEAAMTKALGDVAAIEAEARDLEAFARSETTMSLSVLAARDANIQERLTAAQARIQAAGGNAATLSLLGDGEFTEETGRPRWDALSVAARRSVITSLVERIELRPTDVRLSRWATAEDRLALAAERIVITWRGERDRRDVAS